MPLGRSSISLPERALHAMAEEYSKIGQFKKGRLGPGSWFVVTPTDPVQQPAE